MTDREGVLSTWLAGVGFFAPPSKSVSRRQHQRKLAVKRVSLVSFVRGRRSGGESGSGSRAIMIRGDGSGWGAPVPPIDYRSPITDHRRGKVGTILILALGNPSAQSKFDRPLKLVRLLIISGTLGNWEHDNDDDDRCLSVTGIATEGQDSSSSSRCEKGAKLSWHPSVLQCTISVSSVSRPHHPLGVVQYKPTCEVARVRMQASIGGYSGEGEKKKGISNSSASHRHCHPFIPNKEWRWRASLPLLLLCNTIPSTMRVVWSTTWAIR